MLQEKQKHGAPSCRSVISDTRTSKFSRTKFFKLNEDLYVFMSLCRNVVFSVDKSYVDDLDARKSLDLSLFSTFKEILIDKTQFLLYFSFVIRYHRC